MNIWKSKICSTQLYPSMPHVSVRLNTVCCAPNLSNFMWLSLVPGKGCGFLRIQRTSANQCLTIGRISVLSKSDNWIIYLLRQCRLLAVQRSGSPGALRLLLILTLSEGSSAVFSLSLSLSLFFCKTITVDVQLLYLFFCSCI